MSDVAIRADGLGKRYRIGTRQARYRTLRDTLADAAGMTLRSVRSLLAGHHGDPANDHIWALKDVSFEVKRGEVVGVIGRNGAGKSTLLKILSHITEPTEGGVDLYGRVGSLLEVGTGFHPELTGRENVFLNGTILGMKRSEIEKKFDEIVAFAEIDKFLDTPVKYYSSGMYVRLAFAVAAHLEPEILLVDEVLAVGDAQFQKKCLGKMSDVAAGGRTVLFVSHNMVAVRSLCPTVVLLDGGRIASLGASDEVVSAYLKNGRRSSSSRAWRDPRQAPGNELIRLKSARIVTQTPEKPIDVRTPFQIEFEFWSYGDGVELNYSLVLYTHEEICVLNTVSTSRLYRRGIIRGSCYVPGDFLNAATYRVRILVVQGSRAIFEDTNVLSFEVVDARRTGNWHGTWVGVVRPKLEWATEQATLVIGGEQRARLS